MNIQTLQRVVGRSGLLARKNSPTVLFGAGVVGVVATVVTASRATLKLHTITDEAKENLATARELHDKGHLQYSEKDYRHDVAIIYVRSAVAITKLYGPALTLGVLSVGSLAGSHQILSKRNASLVAAYAALEKGFNEYRGRVIELVGPDKERELRYGAEQREFVEETDTGPQVTREMRVASGTPSIYARFFDQLCPSWSKEAEYNLMFLRCQQNWANDRLHARGHVFLNEVYDMLGVPRSKAGAVVGWVLSQNGDNFVDFGVFDGNNERARDFVNGREGAILLDFNVDGVIFDKI